MIEKNIVIDLWEKYQEKIHVVQNEILGRSIEFQLVSKGLAVNLTDCTVTFYAVKPDGTIVFNACSLVDAARGKVKYTFTAQTVVASGDLSCSLVIVDGSANEIRTQPFAIEVVASPDYTSAVESSSEYTALDTALARVAVNESDISDIDTAIGSRTYTEQNYVTNSESVTASIDALDMAIASAGGGFNTYEYGNEITLTWAQIQTKCLAGDFSGIQIGDWKSIVVGSETVIMEVAGIDTYYGYASNEKHNIDFISRDCLSATYQYNPTNTNIGGWPASALYTAMNGTGGIYDSLPAEVKAVIGPKLMQLENKAAADSTTWAWHTENKLWLPAELEVFGYQSQSEIGYGSGNFKQYPLFAGSEKHIIKGAGNGGPASSWWELSPQRAMNTRFCAVGAAGNADFAGASNTLRIPLCFRVS